MSDEGAVKIFFDKIDELVIVDLVRNNNYNE